MKRISNINIPTDDLSIALSNDKAYTITVTPSIPARFEGWAYSIDGNLYKTFASSAAQDITFSSEGTKTLYFRALKVINGEEILDSEVITGSQYVALPAVESIETSSYSGWNYSTSLTSPSSNAGGSNSKTFWNNSHYHGRGYYHPSSTNKQKMFDGNSSTYAGDYLIKNYSTAVKAVQTKYPDLLQAPKKVEVKKPTPKPKSTPKPKAAAKPAAKPAVKKGK